jgi:hypothetical protein
MTLNRILIIYEKIIGKINDMDSLSTFVPAKPLNTAVLFLVFNRLDTTKQVLEEIKAAKPPRFYIACDGARENKEGESEKVDEIRNYILDNIDWLCDIKTLFRPKNLGCKIAVSSAIEWFFEHEEMGIILEDDCLPSQSFFWYCEELLEKYEDDLRVCSISGNLREEQYIKGADQIYKSIFFNMWGWATWRRQWKTYNVEIFNDSHNIQVDWADISNNKQVVSYWKKILKEMLSHGGATTWDYQMTFLSFIKHQYSIFPKYNLVKNIGFGYDATHTFDSLSEISNVDRKEMVIEKPYKNLDDLIVIDQVFYNEYSIKSIFFRICRKTKRFLVSKFL